MRFGTIIKQTWDLQVNHPLRNSTGLLPGDCFTDEFWHKIKFDRHFILINHITTNLCSCPYSYVLWREKYESNNFIKFGIEDTWIWHKIQSVTGEATIGIVIWKLRGFMVTIEPDTEPNMNRLHKILSTVDCLCQGLDIQTHKQWQWPG